MTDIPAGKMEQPEWEAENEDEIIGRFLFDYEDEIKAEIKKWIPSNKRLLKQKERISRVIWDLLKESKSAQYEQYRDTEDFDHMKEGCRDNVEDR